MRFLLPLFVAIALAACTGGSASPTNSPSPSASPRPTLSPSPSPSPTPAPTPSPTPSPTPEPTPDPGAVIDLSGSHTQQGGFLAVRLRNAPALPAAPAVVLAGLTYQMLAEGDTWYTYVGLPTWFTVGGYPLDIYAGGQVVASGWLDVFEGGFTFEEVTLPPSSGDLLQDTARIEEERQRVDSILAGFTPERYWSGAWAWPAAGNISDAFGTQRSFNGGPYFPHTGLDIANEEGTPIYAAASGYVALAEELYLYGNSVIIDHGAGVFSGYNHMTGVAVAPGAFVSQGDLIGYMGATGLVTGPHLHWEAVVRGVRVDPSLWTQGSADP